MPQPKPLPPVELLRELFDYDPATGVVRYKKPRKRVRVGAPVTREHPAGYLWLSIDRKNYLLHRVIWKMVTGVDPAGEVDHKDRNRKNNAWANLRLATCSHNRCNASSEGKLPRGVVRRQGRTNFYATIQVQGRRKFLGTFDSAEAAHQAYKAASLELQGEFSIYADA